MSISIPTGRMNAVGWKLMMVSLSPLTGFFQTLVGAPIFKTLSVKALTDRTKGHFDSGFDPDAPVVVLLTGLEPRPQHSEKEYTNSSWVASGEWVLSVLSLSDDWDGFLLSLSKLVCTPKKEANETSPNIRKQPAQRRHFSS